MVIELDGESHFNIEAMTYDQERDLFMTTKNLQVLRFTNRQIMQELHEVLEVVRHALETQECIHVE